MTKETRIGYMLKQITLAHEKKLNIMLQEYGLTMSQVRVLLYLFRSDKEHCQVNQREIETHFEISNPTVTGILNRLECKELIKRIAKKDDARVRNIQVTKKAKQLEEMIRQNFKKSEELLLVDFDQEERENLVMYLEKILRNIS